MQSSIYRLYKSDRAQFTAAEKLCTINVPILKIKGLQISDTNSIEGHNYSDAICCC